MSRSRLKFDGILPCDPVLLLEAMDELFPKVDSKSEQEHIELIKENYITSGAQWYKYFKANNLKIQGYYAVVWRILGVSEKDFFEGIYGEKKTEEEHIKIIKKNNIENSNQWEKYYKDNNFKEKKYYYSPWRTADKSKKQFFAEIFGKKMYKTEKEHNEFIKKNNIRGCSQWATYHRDNNLKERSYFTNPWQLFHKPAKQFFEDIYGKKKTEQEHIDFIKKNNIMSSKQWFKYWQDNNLKEQGYLSAPWRVFEKSIKQFFEEISLQVF